MSVLSSLLKLSQALSSFSCFSLTEEKDRDKIKYSLKWLLQMLKIYPSDSELTLFCDDSSATGLGFQDGCLGTTCAETNENSPLRASEG